MKRTLPAACLFALSACSHLSAPQPSVERFEGPNIFRSERPVDDLSAALSESGELVLASGAIRPGSSGQVSFSGLPTCDAAALVLGDTLSIPYTCDGAGSPLSLFHTSSDPNELFQTFAWLVRRSGGAVRVGNNTVTVTAGAVTSEVGAVSGSMPPGVQGSSVPGANSFVVEDGGRQVVTDLMLSVPLTSSLAFVPVPAGVSAEDVSRLGRDFALDVTAVTLGASAYAVVDENMREVFSGMLSDMSSVSVSMSVSSMSQPQLSAYRAEFPGLSLEFDDENGALWLTGVPRVVGDFVRTHRGRLSEPSDFRVDATFLNYREVSSANFELGAYFNLSRGSFSVSNSRGMSGNALRILVEHAQRNGQAAVISRPSLTVRPGVEGRFVSGQSVPVVLSSRSSDSGDTVSQTEYRDTGVVLRVTPRQTSQGVVRLDVHLELSTVSEQSGADGNPVFDTQEITTSVELMPGDTVALSGLLARARSESAGRNSLLPSSASSSTFDELAVFLTLSHDR